MRKLLKCSLLLFTMLSLTACGESEVVEPTWSEKTFFDTLPVPAEKVDKINKDEKNAKYSEYSIYVNSYDYAKFYEYISKLESLGFHYEFFTTSVPEKIDSLTDKTETSWGANNGSIWIRALWRSDKNIYYNGYNFQLIFNNYDYMKEIPTIENVN